MTKDNLIACLSTYQATKKRIENLEEELNKWRNVAMSLGDSIGSGMPSAGFSGNARYTKAVENLADIEAQHLTEIGCLMDSLKTTEQYINLERMPRRKIILQMRYIDGMSIQDIAKAVDRCNSAIYKVHDASVRDILNYLNKKAVE